MRKDLSTTKGLVPARHRRVNNLDIIVLAGGPSEEREVSLASGTCVAGALASLGHRVTVADISPRDLGALDMPADLVFVALHGEFGEDGTVQAELEQRGIPFTGSGSAASSLAMDKVKAKARFIEAGLPTPRFDVARGNRIREVISRWRVPLVVKPVASGSSVDTYMVRDGAVLGQLLTKVIKRYGEALIEELIDGPELTVGILGNRTLPAIEIRTRRGFFDYQAKYIDEDTQYLFDIDLPQELLLDLEGMSLRAAGALGIREFCRVDWRVDRVTHEPYILEINTIPGFTSHSLLPKSAARAGLSFADLCQQIVEMAIFRYDEDMSRRKHP